MSRTVEVETVSDAWLGACQALIELPGQKTTHLVMRMSEPLPERDEVRKAADDFLSSVANVQPIDEVRNTIFPAELAEEFPEPAELAREYLEIYPFVRKLARANSRGTYFGRICAYPRANDSVGSQLEETARKLRAAFQGQRRTSVYELNIYSEWKDARVVMGFPCMSHMAFHIDEDRLDALATYRNHDLIRKGYGNYLGIAELQRYLAAASGFHPGELVVIAGHADLNLSSAKRAELSELFATFA
jgi:thymidylate synthase